MSDKSRIEWTESTWNPVTGCSKVSRGCKNCYAERDWKRLSANPGTIYFGRKFVDVQTHTERLLLPTQWTKPRRIFVNSMSDLFHEDVPVAFIGAVFAVMQACPQHTFQIATKRADLMRKFFERITPEDCREYGLRYTGRMIAGGWRWPLPNVWLGVSVEDQPSAGARVPSLMETPAAVRWISAEPLVDAVDLSPWLEIGSLESDLGLSNPGLDWVVAGGESGPKAEPMNPDWLRSLRDQCLDARVPFFFKQWGEWGPNYLTENGERIESTMWMDRMGKKIAGRMLDGREHSEYPRVPAVNDLAQARARSAAE